MSVKFLSMDFILVDLVKVGFCEMFLNREPYKRVDVRYREKEFLKNKNIIFHINYATH